MTLSIPLVVISVDWSLRLEKLNCAPNFIRYLVTISAIGFYGSKISLLVAVASRWFFHMVKYRIFIVIKELSLRVFLHAVTNS